MKYIISTTGSQIPFAINSNRKILIDPIVPTEVDEAEFILLESRIGSSIQSVDTKTPKPKSPTFTPTTKSKNVVEAKVMTPSLMDADEDGEEKDVI